MRSENPALTKSETAIQRLQCEVEKLENLLELSNIRMNRLETGKAAQVAQRSGEARRKKR